MKIVNRKIKDLIRAEYNPRELTKDQYNQLKDSLLRFGVVDPVIVNKHPDRKDIIVGGHQRSRVWEEMGNDTIPTVEVNLNLEKERELNIRLNKNTGQFDMDMLANHFETDELIEWGFSNEELSFFEPDKELIAEEDEYITPDELDTDIVPGDLFEIGEHRLLCGDSTNSDDVERLMNGKKANMVFTDPPYGVSYEGGHNKKKRKGIENDKLQNDDLSDLFRNSLNVACIYTHSNAPFYIWYASGKSMETYEGLSHTPLEVRAVICWYKVKSGLGAFMAQYIPNYEPCIYAHKIGESIQWFGATDEKTVWELKNDNKNKLHPTQKPIELPERAINNSSKKGQVIYDAFGGSGSTMVASHQLNRRGYLMELDPKYCQVIVDRMMKLDPDLVVKRNGEPYKRASNE